MPAFDMRMSKWSSFVATKSAMALIPSLDETSPTKLFDCVSASTKRMISGDLPDGVAPCVFAERVQLSR